MAKVIKYNLCTTVNTGTVDEPKLEEILSPVTLSYNEANEELAKREAHNGEYTVEDDGQQEPETEQTAEEQLAELSAAVERGLTT